MTDLQSRFDPQRQADLRRMLVAQATPTTGATRHKRLALAGAFAAVVVATGAVAITAFPDPAPVDYAAWTAVPQAAPPLTARHEDIERWASKCSDLGVGGVGVDGVRSRPDTAARREVLVDRRGGFTYCVDVAVGSGTAADPLIALSGLKADGHGGSNSMWSTVFDKPFRPPSGGAVLVLGGDLATPPAGGTGDIRAFQVYGMSGPAVTGVDLVLNNGLRVGTSLRNGIWGVWWPSDRGDPTGSSLVVHTAAGTTTVDAAAVQLLIE
ncbi:hypothetical protein ACWKSP_23085 [Micromonosporaceae bacterium Da 78-11]